MNLLSLKKTHLQGKELLLILFLLLQTIFPAQASAQCKADFKYEINPNTLEVVFAARSNRSPVVFGWRMSDGTVLRGDKIKHQFATAGNYKVCLTAIAFDSSTNQRCTTEVCKEISIVDCDRLKARFVYETDSLKLVVKGESNSNHVVYGYSFGDGTFARGQKARHIYREEGVYEVCLIAKDTITGCIVKDCQRVEVSDNNCGLRAKFGYRQSDNDFKFIAKANMSPARYVWSFGDGETGYGEEIAHSYAKPGIYRVCLVVYAKADDGSICKTETCEKVVIREIDRCELRADFRFKVDDNKLILEARSNEENVHYFWSFGDGNDATGKLARHKYDRPGEYEVCLIVFNPKTKCKVCVCKKVIITRSCDLTADIKYTIHTNFVNFHAKSNAHGNAIYHWDFGDGSQGNGKNIQHSYNSTGRYLVTLKIYDRKKECKVEVSTVVVHIQQSAGGNPQNNSSNTSAEKTVSNTLTTDWVASASPVPSVNAVTIKADKEIDEIKVFDSKGNLILSSKDVELDISSFSKGFYFAHVYATDGSMSTVKFIKE